MKTALDHVGLSVADIERAQAFYARAFDLTPEFEFDLPGAVRGAMLIAPDGHRLELFEAAGSTAGITAATQLEALRTRGYGHFALSAPDIDAIHARAIEAGARSLVAP